MIMLKPNSTQSIENSISFRSDLQKRACLHFVVCLMKHNFIQNIKMNNNFCASTSNFPHILPYAKTVCNLGKKENIGMIIFIHEK